MIAAGKLSATATTGPGSGTSTKKQTPQSQADKPTKPSKSLGGKEPQQAQQTPQLLATPSPSTSPFASSLSPTTTRKRDRSYSASAAVHSAQQAAQIADEISGVQAAAELTVPVTKQPAPKPQHIPTRIQYDDQKKRAKAQKKKIVPMEPAKKQLPLFSHLPQYERNNHLSAAVGFNPNKSSTDVTNNSFIHSSILRLGLKYADGQILGSNARCIAMLTAFKDVVRDYITPPSRSLHRDLCTRISPMIQFLHDCRPKSVSMGNAIKYFKDKIEKTDKMPESEAKEFLLESIDSFINERITVADKVISQHSVSKIEDGDVILTLARSSVVEESLKKAFDEGKSFRVIIADSHPFKEGKKLLDNLVKHGIECTYILFNALSYVIKEVSKVLIGAHTLLANGNVISRAGTAVVAMMAHAKNVPVIVLCESYKFCDLAQLDSICSNELWNPDDLVEKSNSEGPLKNWREQSNLKLLNLVYDLTPMSFVSLVITDVGLIPPTSVPVVLREYSRAQK
eukprot:TRINITY_DN11250_c0_g1_i1.p1 TRINITY_DN11250_c0_g1~~TRINITY_DN11250_c0_g1_i1.p1  ORF type:complete len:511 (-),score=129.22 TRINITY_DN11250_c0_g1_i1:38-1570(-)